MADDAPASPFGNPPVVAPAPVIEPPATNPEAVRDMGLGFLAKHEGAMADRSREVDNIFSKQQLTVDNMSKMLDDTTASLKRAREGRSNLPLMALGAGMLSGTGNFGQQLGAGLKAMVPAIQQQRGDDEDFQYKLATLAMKRAGVENAPLQDKLAYLRALQTGDQASIRSTEAALLKASGQTEKAGDKLNQQREAADQKAINNALAEARKQTDAYYKDQTPDPEERDYETRKRFAEMARAMGINEDSIRKFAPQMVAAPGGPELDPSGKPRPKPVFKGDLVTPGDTEDDEKERLRLGMPAKPVGYIYDKIPSRTDRQKRYATQEADWFKDSKDWDKAQSGNSAQLKNYDEMEMLLDRSPESTGPKWGGVPNRWMQDLKPETQALGSLFAAAQVHDVPQGQGAISNFERELFERTKPNMSFNPEVNRQLIAIQRDIIKDQIEKRAFAETYFGHYKTSQGIVQAWDRYIQSRAGSPAIRDPETGKLVSNPHRMSWQEYFKGETSNGPAPVRRARGGLFAHGGSVGPIHLGDEWGD